jgi:hypothetical protein
MASVTVGTTLTPFAFKDDTIELRLLPVVPALMEIVPTAVASNQNGEASEKRSAFAVTDAVAALAVHQGNQPVTTRG